MEDVELDIRQDALEAIAARALERKTGARGLRSIIEAVLLETMYEIPSKQGVHKVVVDAAAIEGDSEPLLVYENSEPVTEPKKTASDDA